MKNSILLLICSILSVSNVSGRKGDSCNDAYLLLPALTCDNNTEFAFDGSMQCPTADCNSYILMNPPQYASGKSCMEADGIEHSVAWFRIITSDTSFTIHNRRAYFGPRSEMANTKQFTIYSGTCGELKEISCHVLKGNTSFTLSSVDEGKEYFIRASALSKHGAYPAISICITAAKVYEPSGKHCAEAVDLRSNQRSIFTNAGAIRNTALQHHESSTWYKWNIPTDWPIGQEAFVKIKTLYCNSDEGLKISLWNSDGNCPDIQSMAISVNRSPVANEEYFHQWTPTAGKAYYFSISGIAGIACEFSLEVGMEYKTSVHMISLHAKSDGKGIQLNWITGEENDNRSFEIEKSSDGINFLPLANLEGAGYSVTDRQYSCHDEYPFAGINYYRLRQTDSEGEYSYSKTIAVIVKGEGQLFHAWSDPMCNNIDIAYFSKLNEEAFLRIFNDSGKQMFSMPLQFKQGRNEYRINSRLFPQGNYRINIETPDAIYSKAILLEVE